MNRTAHRTGLQGTQLRRTAAAAAAGLALVASALTVTTASAANAAGSDSAADGGATLPTCSTELHDSYQAVAQDGTKYPTWHPATVTDPGTGKKCTFGHEHGDDPTTSKIFKWTMEKLGPKATGVAFGYAAMQSMKIPGAAHRHEDHYGAKVFVRNDVKLVRADRGGYAKAAGKPVTCDYLIYEHQGSHSGDALKNNQHELLYSTKCSDGTEMVVSTLTGYGNANEYTANCSGETVKTTGPDLPDGAAGAREIPNAACATKTQGEFWGLYELWKVDHTIKDSAGNVLVSFDPWFGVRNPSRVGDSTEGKESDPTDTIGLLQDTWTTYPWNRVKPGVGKEDPASPFTGAQRDFYVQDSTIANRGGSTAFYTDAYGQKASRTPFDGAITQYAASVDNSALPKLERRAFGFSTDYAAGNQVHAPN